MRTKIKRMSGGMKKRRRSGDLTRPTPGEKHAGDGVVAVATPGHCRAHTFVVGCGASGGRGRGNGRRITPLPYSPVEMSLLPCRRRCRRRRVQLFSREGGGSGERKDEYRFASLRERIHEVEAVDLTPVGFKGFRGVWTWM
jgi:hypothetical protein